MCVTAPSGVPCAAESGDAMGTAVSVGDYNGDGYADVQTGAPNEDHHPQLGEPVRRRHIDPPQGHRLELACSIICLRRLRTPFRNDQYGRPDGLIGWRWLRPGIEFRCFQFLGLRATPITHGELGVVRPLTTTG
ncbi:FG-GAP repeat protein [Streptomyces sp. NPDC002596]|uniref:FG-GAP repeat protein n=1 Tax=Streptomyces sp. NPDC059460 TaxID=3346840 RepID=UPI0036A6744E